MAKEAEANKEADSSTEEKKDDNVKDAEYEEK